MYEAVRKPGVAFGDFTDPWCDVCGAKVDYEKDRDHPFTCRCYARYLKVKRLKAHKGVRSLRHALLVVFLLSGCAHWNPDAATVAVSVAEIVVDILLGVAQ